MIVLVLVTPIPRANLVSSSHWGDQVVRVVSITSHVRVVNPLYVRVHITSHVQVSQGPTP